MERPVLRLLWWKAHFRMDLSLMPQVSRRRFTPTVEWSGDITQTLGLLLNTSRDTTPARRLHCKVWAKPVPKPGKEEPCSLCVFDSTDIASMAWRGRSQMSTSPVPRGGGDRRRCLCSKPQAEPPPPPPTAYGRLRTRRDAHRGLPGPGHATHSRTLGQREASAINDWRRCPRGPRGQKASGIGSGRSPRTLPTRLAAREAAPSPNQRLPKATPSPRRRDKDHDKRWTARRRPR